MVKKSKSFLKNLKNDLRILKIDKNIPKLKGSFLRMPNNNFVTDIDCKVQVKFNENLSNSLLTMLKKVKNSKSFTFFFLKCGWKTDLTLPWQINQSGSCEFDIFKVYEWYETIKQKKLVSKEILEKINKILISSKHLVIADLIKVHEILKPIASLKWTTNDISKGILDEQTLEEVLQKNSFGLMEFLYSPGEEQFVSLSVSLNDQEFPEHFKRKRFFPFYTKNYYKIIKSFRRKLFVNKSYIFNRTMAKINLLSSYLYQVKLLLNLINFKPKMKNEIEAIWRVIKRHFKGRKRSIKTLKVLASNLQIGLNKKALKAFPQKIWRRYVNGWHNRFKIEIELERMRQSNNSVSKKELKKRALQGVSCPFFEITIESLNKIVDFSLRVRLSVEKLVICFTKVSNQLRKNINSIILENIKNNNLSIFFSKNNKISLVRSNKTESVMIKSYFNSPEKLKELQKFIFLSEAWRPSPAKLAQEPRRGEAELASSNNIINQKAARLLRSIYMKGAAFPEWTITHPPNKKPVHVFYSSGTLKNAKMLAKQREPVNIAMNRLYDINQLKTVFGWAYGAYSKSSTEKLMPNLAISCIATFKKQNQFVDVPVINLIGLAFDSIEQPDYKFVKAKPFNQRSKFIRQHYTKLWEFAFRDIKLRGLEKLVFYDVGAGAFSQGLQSLLPQFDFNKMLIETRKQAQINEDAGEITVIRGCSPIAHCLFSKLENKALYVNAWDPWSIVGNGNNLDASLDGAYGRSSNMGVLCSPITNPSISKYIKV